MAEQWQDEMPEKSFRKKNQNEGVPLSLAVQQVNDLLEKGSSRKSRNDAKEDYRTVVFRCGRRRTIRLNHNVFLMFVVSVTYGMSTSLWTESVLSAYLQELFNDQNSRVGLIETFHGLALLVSALPVGRMADTYGRDVVIRIGSAIFMITAVLHAAIMFWAGDGQSLSTQQTSLALVLFLLTMSLWGVGSGVADGPSEALFADSTPAGDRTRFFNYKHVLEVLSQTLGPLVAIMIFSSEGDDWSSRTLQIIIFVGLLMEVMNAFIYSLFDDSKALDEHEGVVAVDSSSESDSGSDKEESNIIVPVDDSEGDADEPLKDEPDATTTNDPGENREPTGGDSKYYFVSRDKIAALRKWIPYLIVSSNIVDALGGGMTTKFLALYLKDDVGLTPNQVQWLYVFIPIFTAIFSWLATWIAKSFGRIQTTLVFHFISVVLFYMFIFMESTLVNHLVGLSIIFVVMEALGESCEPLMESTLMDAVPKNQRATWMSLDSISEFGWAGSAWLGGYLSDEFGYTQTFLLTAHLELLALVFLVLLLPLVPVKEGDLKQWKSLVSSSNGAESPDYEDMDWKELPQDVKGAALFLGYNKKMWDNEEEPPICDRDWSRLSPEQQSAAGVLGFDQSSWDAE